MEQAALKTEVVIEVDSIPVRIPVLRIWRPAILKKPLPEPKPLSYEVWVKELQAEVTRILGFGTDDLPAVDLKTLYQMEPDPKEAAEYVIEYASVLDSL